MRARWIPGVVSALLSTSGCFAGDAVLGLPCRDDPDCGPSHVCALGYCRASLEDALAGCGDDAPARGELCYPLATRVELPLGEGEWTALHWGDLDGDPRPDAVTLSEQSVVIHRNLGGTFSSTPVATALTPASLAALGVEGPVGMLTVPVRARHLALGDFVGGPRDDVVFTLAVSPEIPDELAPLRELAEAQLWLAENRGDAFGDPRPLPDSTGVGAATLLPFGMRRGDFDGDGRDDLVVTVQEPSGASSSRWLRGTGEGLGGPQAIPALGGGLPPRVADVDEDGRDDLLVSRLAVDEVAVFLGPQLDAESLVVTLPPGARAVELAPLDDQPGLDLAVLVEASPPRLELWSWNGAGFSPATTAQTASGRDLSAGDLDGDGLVDLLTLTEDGVAVHSGFEGPELGAPFGIVDEAALRLELRDLDDDLTPDLVLEGSRRLVVYFANP